MIPTAESLKETLKNRLVESVEKRCELIKSANSLRAIGIYVRDLDNNSLDCMDQVTAKVVRDICKVLTEQYNNGTPVEIKLNEKLYQLTDQSYKRPIRLTQDEANIFADCNNGENIEKEKGLIDFYLKQLNCNAIIAEINRQISEFENTGLRLIAASIIDQLGVVSLAKGIKERNNRIVLETSAFTYNEFNYKLQQLNNLQFGLDRTGLSFGGGVQELIAVGGKLSCHYTKIRSKSVFGKNTILEIHCFNDKHEYRFTREGFDAILAFISLNGFEDVANQVLDALNMAEAA